MRTPPTGVDRVVGPAAPLVRANVDTDVIIRSRDISEPGPGGLGDRLFASWRYDAVGREIAGFVLNQAPYRQAAILLAGGNFGCGSSREAAVWALRDFGVRSVIAPSFGSIFQANCVTNGIVPVVLPVDDLDDLEAQILSRPGADVVVDLVAMQVSGPEGHSHIFRLPAHYRQMLREGIDAVASTRRWRETIDAFETADRVARPWMYEHMNNDTRE